MKAPARRARIRSLCRSTLIVVFTVLVAAACGGSTGSGTTSNDVDSAPAAADASDGSPEAPVADEANPYGPEPAYTRVRIDPTTPLGGGDDVYGSEIVRTIIEGSEPGNPDATVSYASMSADGGPPSVWLSRSDDEAITLCLSDQGCAGGTIDMFRRSAVKALIFTAPDDPFTSALPLAPILHPSPTSDAYWGFVFDEDITVGEYQGRCFISEGEWIPFPGDPVTETTFDAGDRMCVLYYGTGSSQLVSYDFGGDGAVEFQLVEVRSTWSESELVAQDGAVSVATDQAKLDNLIESLLN